MLEFLYPGDLTPVQVSQLDLDQMWQTHGAYIFQSDTPPSKMHSFYPIYRYKNLYSFSVLPLIMHKKELVINNTFIGKNLVNGSDVATPDMTIDKEIERLGAPAIWDQSISNLEYFVAALAAAMQKDAERVFDQNPGKSHYVLCGGKDSLNILLLPWPTKVVALSAQPNLPLVKKFVLENNLDIEVRELHDLEPATGLTREIAEAGCLVDLSSWKWTEHLRRISKTHHEGVIFWKGQAADASLTDYWRSYTSSNHNTYKNLRKSYRKLAKLSPVLMDYMFCDHAINDFQKSIWKRAAVAQGAHLGFLRSICNALFLSAYHGPEAGEVMRRIDLKKIGSADLRPEIGRALFGRSVRYPLENPAPPLSSFRRGKRTVAHFTAALKDLGIEVNE